MVNKYIRKIYAVNISKDFFGIYHLEIYILFAKIYHVLNALQTLFFLDFLTTGRTSRAGRTQSDTICP